MAARDAPLRPMALFLLLNNFLLMKDKWKSVLQFIITVLTAILGSMSVQSCFAFA